MYLLSTSITAICHVQVILAKPVNIRINRTDTFKVWSYPGIIARRSSHQFVQKVRRRHGHLPTPCGVFHFFTQNRAVKGEETDLFHLILCDIFTTGCTSDIR